MKNTLILLALCLTFSAALFAQTPTPPQADEDEVVKITTKLVQVDAVVTDKKGNPVTDLTADDFEVWQDGKLQKITNFSFINTEIPKEISTATVKKVDKQTTFPPSRTNSAGTGRIITFIVDDGNCTASLVGMTATREAMEKFITEQMQPDDLVAIYRTRGGTSLLQQYTSDKSQLMRVARQIRWYPPQGSCRFSDGSFFEAARANSMIKNTPLGPTSVQIESEAVRQRREASEDFNRSNQVIGTLGVLRYAVRGLERVGGRKVVFLFSDGIPMRARDGSMLNAVDYLRDLTDLANRASVVFNVIDVHGVFSSSIVEARDEILPGKSPNPAAPTGSDEVVTVRQAEVRNTRDGMLFLADETGGRFYQGGNFLDTTLKKALNQEKGYYLLAYEPADETFKGKKFHNIAIKLKSPELRVSSRAGFFGRTDEETKTKKRTADSELYDAIAAPLLKTGLNLRLTAFFGNMTEGNFVRSLIHLDGNDLTFADDVSGMKKVVLDVVAVTLNEKNEVIDEFNRTHTFKFEAKAVPFIKQNGLIYTTDVPVKKAGTYNFRVAVRDASSKELGSASQVVEIPDLKKGKLYLSSLSVSQVDANGKFIVPAAVKPEEALSFAASSAVPAVRTFRRGMILAYSYNLYNVEIDKTANQPKISIQVNLYRNGNLINEGKPQPAQLEAQSDWSRIKDYGYLKLNQNVQAGDYVLQIIVKDLTTNQTASQWIDFEVVN